jgi:hypothetical protein
MILGTRSHKALEGSEDECSLLEEKFDGDDVDETGIADAIETEVNKIILIDTKTSGSYKVAKALGFKVVEKESDEVYKTGKRKGEKKTIKELVRSIDYEDRWEWEFQTNKYRIEYEKKYKQKIDELKIQCIVRDGGTYIARSRGVFRNIYYFKLRILPDEEVLEFFKRKREALLQALKQGYWNQPCDRKENWEGLKCQRYCSVAEFCNYGKYLKAKKQTEDEMIKGLSDVRRLPRLGKIRLGEKKVSEKTGNEYPVEFDYFKIDPATPSPEENKKLTDQFHKLFGEKPKQIKVMFPLPDPKDFFPQYFKRYGNNVLRCKGDGETATCISQEYAQQLKVLKTNETGGLDVKCEGKLCPYYKSKKCGESAALSFLIPDLPGAGVWQITTGSVYSIISMNSCLDYVRALCGRVHMIPLTLERVEADITYEGKPSKHYILHLNMDITLGELQRYAQIDPTKALLAIPEPDIDKEDILFQENRLIDAPAVPESKEIEVNLCSEQQLLDLHTVLHDQKIIPSEFKAWLKAKIGVDTIEEIPAEKFGEVVKAIIERKDEIKAAKVAKPAETKKPSIL